MSKRYFGIDISERDPAEQAKRRTDELFRALIENSSDVITIIDAQGIIRYESPSVERVLGYSAAELVGVNFVDLVHPEDVGLSNAALEALASESGTPGIQLMEVRCRHKDRSWRLLEGVAKILDTPPARSIVINSRDITERKQRERELEAIATVSAALRTAASHAEMLPVILDQLLDLLNVEGAALAMRNPVSGETSIELARGEWAPWTGLRLPPGEGVSGHVIATGQPYATDDVEGDPRMTHRDLLGGLRAVVCVPLIAHQQTIGALWVGHISKIADNEVRLLAAICDIAANAIRRAALHEQTERRLVQVQGLNEIDKTIMGSVDIPATLNILLLHLVEQLHIAAADILLFDPVTKTLDYAAGRGFTSSLIEDSRLHLGEGMAGRAALERRLIHATQPIKAEHEFSRSQLIKQEGFASYYGVPLIAQGKIKGVLEIFHRVAFEGDPEWLSLLDTLAARATIAIDSAQLFHNLEKSKSDLVIAYDSTIEGWSRALDLRDKETEGHTQRVTEISVRLARQMGIAESKLIHVRRGALLHDVGKMGVPDSILRKPGSLTDAEWIIMRQHPVQAYELLSPITYLRAALDIPYCHHEKWDGTGYPRGSKGEEIPFTARIFAIVDVWDALRSVRPYRDRWPEEKVRAYLKQQSGQHFDPKVVVAFLGLLDVLVQESESGIK